MSPFRQIVAFAVRSCLLLHMTTANAEGRPDALPDLRIAYGQRNIAEAWLADMPIIVVGVEGGRKIKVGF